MRNLKLTYNKYNAIKIDSEAQLCIDPLTKFAYGINKSGIFCLSNTGEENITLKKKLWSENGISVSRIIAADTVTSLNCICISTSEGDVITVNLEDGLIDVAGSVSDGIAASCWSPDQELFALVTGASNVVMMTPDFDPVFEISLKDDDFGENEFINVGWGKKETQFHGSEGKEAAKNLKNITSKVSEYDDLMPKICWRGDGQLFAISFIDSSKNCRKFKVISRDGVLQSTSEPVEALEDQLSWKPSRNLIASSQRLSNKHKIIFFEKNGLQHGGFDLPFAENEMVIKGLAWNQDSTVLTLCLQSLQTNKYIVQFWKIGNYHWYLKDQIEINGLLDVKWDSECPSSFYVLSKSGFHVLKYANCIDCSLGSSSSDNAVVAVIDGKSLLVTPFRHTVVPPPLSAYTIKFPDQVHAVMFAPGSSSQSESLNNSLTGEDSGFLESIDHPGANANNFLVFHGENTLTCFGQVPPAEGVVDFGIEVSVGAMGGNGFSVTSKIHRACFQTAVELEQKTEEQDNFSPLNLYNWSWITKNIVIAAHTGPSTNYIVVFNLENIGSENSQLLVKSIVEVEEQIISISSCPDGSVVVIQTATGRLLSLIEESVSPWIEDEKAYVFPNPCDEVLICALVNKKHIPIGRTSRNRLYIGNTQVLSNCTSMHIHSDHILFTTTSHNLLVVPKTLDGLLSLAADIPQGYSLIGSRALERGSRIVTSVPEDTKVLLQMPRGNLEMINPRPLTIHHLKKLLDENNYRTAMDIMRRHRIDMNLIYDHSPKAFLNQIEYFIESVQDAHMIDLFIASLTKEDVTQTYYSAYYPKIPSKTEELHLQTKVDLVCETLRSALQKVDQEQYLLPILSTYVKSTKGEIHLALMKLKEMNDRPDKVYKVTFEEGLRHLLYVCDVNELCDVALGTFDFDLVMMIYAKSQKDPKEYLPFLRNLKKLEESYRKYRINVYLKRPQKALECISACDSKYHNEFLNYIIKENLYNDALTVINRNLGLYKDICVAYADYLSVKGFYNEAAAVYSRGNNLNKALDAYYLANNWRRVIAASLQMKQSKEEFKKLCMNLIDNSISKNLFGDAAYIYEYFIHSEEDAVELYCRAFQWEEAFLLASKHQRFDLVETNIKPSALERFKDLCRTLKETREQFEMLCDRLSIVRCRKKEEYTNFIEGNEDESLDPELYSDSSTVTGISYQRSNLAKSIGQMSSASAKTYRSSKNKRKLERKKYSTKEGSAFEDIGLVVAVHELMTSTMSISSAVSDLNRFLITVEEISSAKCLQDLLETIVEEMKKKKFIIWLNCAPQDEEDSEFGPQMSTEAAVKQLKEESRKEDYIIRRMADLEPHYRFPPHLESISGWKLFALK